MAIGPLTSSGTTEDEGERSPQLLRRLRTREPANSHTHSLHTRVCTHTHYTVDLASSRALKLIYLFISMTGPLLRADVISSVADKFESKVFLR